MPLKASDSGTAGHWIGNAKLSYERPPPTQRRLSVAVIKTVLRARTGRGARAFGENMELRAGATLARL
jgi:hypothetical protein